MVMNMAVRKRDGVRKKRRRRRRRRRRRDEWKDIVRHRPNARSKSTTRCTNSEIKAQNGQNVFHSMPYNNSKNILTKFVTNLILI